MSELNYLKSQILFMQYNDTCKNSETEKKSLNDFPSWNVAYVCQIDGSIWCDGSKTKVYITEHFIYWLYMYIYGIYTKESVIIRGVQ